MFESSASVSLCQHIDGIHKYVYVCIPERCRSLHVVPAMTALPGNIQKLNENISENALCATALD